MEHLGLYFLLGYVALILPVGIYKNRTLRLWIRYSIMYLFDKRKITKKLESNDDDFKRDFWLNNFILKEPKYWYERAMEKYIRLKYINRIVEGYGSI